MSNEYTTQARRGSRINTDRFPKRGAEGVPFPGFLSNARKLEKENTCPDHFPDFNLESSIIILLLKMFIVKNLTDFRKTVEIGVDPRLQALFQTLETKKMNSKQSRPQRLLHFSQTCEF